MWSHEEAATALETAAGDPDIMADMLAWLHVTGSFAINVSVLAAEHIKAEFEDEEIPLDIRKFREMLLVAAQRIRQKFDRPGSVSRKR